MPARLWMLSLLLTAVPAFAFDGKPIGWLCWYDDQDAILCMPKAVSIENLRQRTNYERRDVDPRLPPIVDAIWNDPETLRNQIITIPMLAAGVEAEFSSRLASSVVCGSNVNCRVEYFDAAAAPGLGLAQAAARGEGVLAAMRDDALDDGD